MYIVALKHGRGLRKHLAWHTTSIAGLRTRVSWRLSSVPGRTYVPYPAV
jgi:hypothetical protein